MEIITHHKNGTEVMQNEAVYKLCSVLFILKNHILYFLYSAFKNNFQCQYFRHIRIIFLIALNRRKQYMNVIIWI